MNVHLISRHVQAVALRFCGYSASIENIARFVALSMGDDAPPMPELIHYLRKESTHKELAENFEVALWKGPSAWRLVSLATPATIEDMELRLNNYPVDSGTQCAWCMINEHNHYATELVRMRNLDGSPVHRRSVHKLCYRPWAAMVTQVARANAGAIKK